MKTAMVMILSLLTFSSFAQTTSIWRGNAPGHENKWECPSNWSNNRVPDEFTNVIIQVDISNRHKYPVLNMIQTEINSLSIWPGAYIYLKTGDLYILDPERNYFNRTQVIGKGRVVMVDDPHYVTSTKSSEGH